MNANTKSRTVIEYIVDIWLPMMTIIEEKFVVEENVETLEQKVKATWGPFATFMNVRENRTFTF